MCYPSIFGLLPVFWRVQVDISFFVQKIKLHLVVAMFTSPNIQYSSFLSALPHHFYGGGITPRGIYWKTSCSLFLRDARVYRCAEQPMNIWFSNWDVLHISHNIKRLSVDRRRISSSNRSPADHNVIIVFCWVDTSKHASADVCNF